MNRAYKLFTGPDGNAHVVAGSVVDHKTTVARSISFQESPARSSADWHHDPATQYVVTLSGVLEFTTRGGESFTVKPGDIVVVLDGASTGHKWRLIDDQPWKRAYVVFDPSATINFRAEGIKQ
jgi:quercetin dioxygenase-like cupin family protein